MLPRADHVDIGIIWNEWLWWHVHGCNSYTTAPQTRQGQNIWLEFVPKAAKQPKARNHLTYGGHDLTLMLITIPRRSDRLGQSLPLDTEIVPILVIASRPVMVFPVFRL